jgi:hypothetical protein
MSAPTAPHSSAPHASATASTAHPSSAQPVFFVGSASTPGDATGSHAAPPALATGQPRHLLTAPDAATISLADPLRLDVWSPRITPLEALVSQFLAPGMLGAILFFVLDRTDWTQAARGDNFVGGGATWPAVLGQVGLAGLLATVWLDMFRRQQSSAGQAGVWLDGLAVLSLGAATVWVGNVLWPAIALSLVGLACLARVCADWQARTALGRDVAASSCGLACAQIIILLAAISSGGSPETQAISILACVVVGLMAEAVAQQTPAT